MSQPEARGLGQLGEYRLLEKLGEGGMGTVYRALHTGLGRIVALKVLSGGRTEDEQAVARFQREMKAVGRLDHPNIVRAHDAREIDGQLALVMEFVDGLDLGELVERLGPLPVADACELVRQAAAGLEHAHRHGLVHRDIKPSNLMLSAKGQVKVLDMGLALVHAAWPGGEDMTVPGQVMGTPDYMAPEQASDSHVVDIRADVYSLGCTLYKLLTGRPPYSGPAYGTAYKKMNAHVHEPPPSIRQFRDDVPKELATVLQRMLAKDPRQRFATPGELATALSPFTSGADLPRLAADAEKKTPSPTSQTEPVVKLQQRTASSVAVTFFDRAAEPGEPVSSVALRPRKWWAIAAGLVLLIAGAGVSLAILFGSGEEPLPTPTPGPKPIPPPPPPPPPVEKRVWFVLSWTPPWESGKPDLWLIGLLGKDQRRVTHDPGSYDVQPQFSPNGRRIVFLRAESPTGSSAVCVCDTDGGNLRTLVTADPESERIVSPVWVSDSLIYYTRESISGSSADTEIWRIDADDGKPEPQRVFGFKADLEQLGGAVTDVSPDGRLAVIAQQGRSSSTADVYVTDLHGDNLEVVWEDLPDECMDARALWSPAGGRIAWHHFTRSPDGRKRSGVAWAERLPDGRWDVRLQPEEQTSGTPIAWSADGRALLCAKLHLNRDEGDRAEFSLMSPGFRKIRELFDLPVSLRQPPQWRFCRLGDWATLPKDVPLPPPAKHEPRPPRSQVAEH